MKREHDKLPKEVSKGKVTCKGTVGSIRAQHEIMGFVLIVVVVSIIGLVFLSLSIGRGQSTRQNSADISNLLEASMYYTTDCAVNYVPQYKDGQELIKSCYNENIGNYLNCLDGRNVCEALESTFRRLVKESLNAGEGFPNKAYKLNMYSSLDRSSDSKIELIPEISEGVFRNCSSIVGGHHLIDVTFSGSGTIYIELEVCREF